MDDKTKFIPVICTVYITEDDMKALIRIRNYFGENDKTQLEHLAYDVLDRVVKPFVANFDQTETNYPTILL